MKALVKAKPEPGIWMQEEPMPETGPNDVRIQIRKTAICGTDVHISRWAIEHGSYVFGVERPYEYLCRMKAFTTRHTSRRVT